MSSKQSQPRVQEQKTCYNPIMSADPDHRLEIHLTCVTSALSNRSLFQFCIECGWFGSSCLLWFILDLVTQVVFLIFVVFFLLHALLQNALLVPVGASDPEETRTNDKQRPQTKNAAWSLRIMVPEWQVSLSVLTFHRRYKKHEWSQCIFSISLHMDVKVSASSKVTCKPDDGTQHSTFAKSVRKCKSKMTQSTV